MTVNHFTSIILHFTPNDNKTGAPFKIAINTPLSIVPNKLTGFNLSMFILYTSIFNIFESLVSRAFYLHVIHVAFVEDDATSSSIRYFENHVSYFVKNRRKQTLLNSFPYNKYSTQVYNEQRRIKKKQNQGIDDCNTFFFN